jgi:hypothetical protein
LDATSLKDGIVLRCREGEFVYAWREERFFGAALDPQFTTEGEHRGRRRYTTDMVVVSMS